MSLHTEPLRPGGAAPGSSTKSQVEDSTKDKGGGITRFYRDPPPMGAGIGRDPIPLPAVGGPPLSFVTQAADSSEAVPISDFAPSRGRTTQREAVPLSDVPITRRVWTPMRAHPTTTPGTDDISDITGLAEEEHGSPRTVAAKRGLAETPLSEELRDTLEGIIDEHAARVPKSEESPDFSSKPKRGKQGVPSSSGSASSRGVPVLPTTRGSNSPTKEQLKERIQVMEEQSARVEHLEYQLCVRQENQLMTEVAKHESMYQNAEKHELQLAEFALWNTMNNEVDQARKLQAMAHQETLMVTKELEESKRAEESYAEVQS